ncbi:MAG TPA: ABC transporter ATP-binding protein [Streptosporangiaceae bacterium]|nr:ABC transporter ATP-binding protein [Streptosporangiaceae bacterium]
MTEPVLKALDLHVSFGQTPALRGATVVAERAEFVAIMGPSGSGKSTLLHCLAGIYVPGSGEVHYNGKRVDRMPDKQRTKLRRTEFGFVFQFGQLVPELSAVDNIAVPLLLNRVSRRNAYRRAQSWLDRLGISELARRRTGELSGGQAQRVAIGRALVLHPKVLFADEPTGSLDSQTGRQVLDLLTGVAREEGSTVVLVTHDARVAACADRTVHVTDGLVSAAVQVGGAR